MIDGSRKFLAAMLTLCVSACGGGGDGGGGGAAAAQGGPNAAALQAEIERQFPFTPDQPLDVTSLS